MHDDAPCIGFQTGAEIVNVPIPAFLPHKLGPCILTRAKGIINQAKVCAKIRHNGVPRTFRDREDVAFEATRFAKTRHPADIIEIVNCATGQKVIMLADGRTG
jgi:hypothetical protein